jgi:hypothetical protein
VQLVLPPLLLPLLEPLLLVDPLLEPLLLVEPLLEPLLLVEPPLLEPLLELVELPELLPLLELLLLLLDEDEHATDPVPIAAMPPRRTVPTPM